jgi:hypothetical protein
VWPGEVAEHEGQADGGGRGLSVRLDALVTAGAAAWQRFALNVAGFTHEPAARMARAGIRQATRCPEVPMNTSHTLKRLAATATAAVLATGALTLAAPAGAAVVPGNKTPAAAPPQPGRIDGGGGWNPHPPGPASVHGPTTSRPSDLTSSGQCGGRPGGV